MPSAKKLVAVAIFALAFLAGNKVALKAQCQACYQNPGPAGQVRSQQWFGQCPCDPYSQCWYTYCSCYPFYWSHMQCSPGPPVNVCIGC
jgi:hypothetical protein